MTPRKKFIVLSAGFTAYLFLMAGVYDILWLFRPDYFRIQSGVNFLSIELFNISREYSSVPNGKPLPIVSENPQEESGNALKKIYEEFRSASVKLAEQQASLEKAEAKSAADYKVFDASIYQQMEEYVLNQTSPFKSRLVEPDQKLKAMLEAAGVASPDNLPPSFDSSAYWQTDIERAQLNVERAQAELQAREFTVHNVLRFEGRPDQQAYLAERKFVDQQEKDVFDLQNVVDKKHGELYNAFIDYLQAVHSQLTYWDFLYFSVGAATTATFGDISPNHVVVRLLVCFQVLVSIVSVAKVVVSWPSRSP